VSETGGCTVVGGDKFSLQLYRCNMDVINVSQSGW